MGSARFYFSMSMAVLGFCLVFAGFQNCAPIDSANGSTYQAAIDVKSGERTCSQSIYPLYNAQIGLCTCFMNGCAATDAGANWVRNDSCQYESCQNFVE